MGKKFEVSDEVMEHYGIRVKRIRALISFDTPLGPERKRNICYCLKWQNCEY